jgi:hypothetical protein
MQATSSNMNFDDHYVAHYELRQNQLRRFRALLNSSPPERHIQSFLEENREIVAAFLGVHSVFVFPKPKLGSHYEADFGVAEWNSAGKFWKLIELEPPSIKPFRRDGRPSARLTHALEQIREWRRFIRVNLDYCQRSRDKNGLGFEDLTDRFWGVIVMGRRRDYDTEPEGWRPQLREESQIDLMSYDRFLEWPAAIAERSLERKKATRLTIVIDGKSYLDLTLPQAKYVTVKPVHKR